MRRGFAEKSQEVSPLFSLRCLCVLCASAVKEAFTICLLVLHQVSEIQLQSELNHARITG